MNAIIDTVVWLAYFPAMHGYAMVFIAGFSLFGLIPLALRRAGAPSRLQQLRAAAGDVRPATGGRRIVAVVQSWLWRVLAVTVLAGGVIGLLTLIGVPVVESYVHANGATAEATVDGDYVTFTASDGVTYTLPYDFFTSPSYPEADKMLASDDSIVVRYLESHPQAFVVDTERSETFF